LINLVVNIKAFNVFSIALNDIDKLGDSLMAPSSRTSTWTRRMRIKISSSKILRCSYFPAAVAGNSHCILKSPPPVFEDHSRVTGSNSLGILLNEYVDGAKSSCTHLRG
jgi:hypothetical protein